MNKLELIDFIVGELERPTEKEKSGDILNNWEELEEVVTHLISKIVRISDLGSNESDVDPRIIESASYLKEQLIELL